MTTIAFRDGVLAADRQCCQGDLINGTVTKIFRIGENEFAAFAGSLPNGLAFIEWARNAKQEKPKLSESFVGIICTPYFVKKYEECLRGYEVEAEYVAFGSGRDYAMGAMAAGASAEDAVKAAIKHDPWTGAGIDILKFE